MQPSTYLLVDPHTHDWRHDGPAWWLHRRCAQCGPVIASNRFGVCRAGHHLPDQHDSRRVHLVRSRWCAQLSLQQPAPARRRRELARLISAQLWHRRRDEDCAHRAVRLWRLCVGTVYGGPLMSSTSFMQMSFEFAVYVRHARLCVRRALVAEHVCARREQLARSRWRAGCLTRRQCRLVGPAVGRPMTHKYSMFSLFWSDRRHHGSRGGEGK